VSARASIFEQLTFLRKYSKDRRDKARNGKNHPATESGGELFRSSFSSIAPFLIRDHDIFSFQTQKK
jgi:hypothetical protein